MKVLSLIIQRIAVDVVDDLAAHSASNLAVFPFAAAPFATVSKAKVAFLLVSAVTVRLLDRGIGCNGGRLISGGADHPIAPAVVLAGWQSAAFPLVRIERVSVVAPHLIVTPAHFPSDHRLIAVRAWSPHNLPAPTIISRAVLSHSLVVHQAKAVRCVFSPATVYLASSHAANDNTFLETCHVRWIGERIAAVEAMRAESLAA